jgi:hypothetical protein
MARVLGKKSSWEDEAFASATTDSIIAIARALPNHTSEQQRRCADGMEGICSKSPTSPAIEGRLKRDVDGGQLRWFPALLNAHCR